jgi:heme oxygenase
MREEKMPLQKVEEARSARARLRHATDGMHRAVDSRFAGLLADAADGYERFLTAIAGGLLPLERALTRAHIERIWPDWPYHARSAALHKDLARLDIDVPAQQAEPHLNSEAEILGVVYVLEGSRLGGAFILRELRRSADPARLNAIGYLSHGEGQGLWPRFLQHLEASDAVKCAPEEAEAGAALAFSYFLPHREHDLFPHEELVPPRGIRISRPKDL